MWKLIIGSALIIAVAGAALVKVGGGAVDERPAMRVSGAELSGYAGSAPEGPIDLLFLHHSVGEQLLAAPGPASGKVGGPTTHPNGGGLRALLVANNYRVHEATYGSALGEKTDLFDWLPKFRDHMDEVLSIRLQDDPLPGGARNQVVVFKPCFPNNQFVGAGEGEGNPAGPALTEANARATMTAVRAELAKRPDVLFVYVTAPPLAPRTWADPAWKWLVKKAIGRRTPDDVLRASGESARRFNNWVNDPAGWLAGYPHRNIVVFDLYDLLTDRGASNFLRYPTGDGFDSHPSSEGNLKVAPELVACLNRAVRYSGIVR